MGRITVPARSSEPDALSLRTTPDDYQYDEPILPAEELPSYAESEAMPSSLGRAHVDTIPATDEYGNAQLDRILTQSDGPPRTVGEATIRIDDKLNDPDNLFTYITNYVRVTRAKPMIRIDGWHTESEQKKGGKKSNTVEDFEITLSLEQYLSKPYTSLFWHDRVVQNGDKAFRGSWRKTKAPGYTNGIQLSDDPVPDLMSWCRTFCECPSKLKAFRVERRVEGIDTVSLQKEIEKKIRETFYRGTVKVSFPVTDRYVDIYSSNFANHWRTSWVRYLFYFTFLWIIIWPVLFFMTKWYGVYTVHWKFSHITPNPSDPRRNRVQYATISEAKWIEMYGNLIKQLAMTHYMGNADHFPPEEAAAPSRDSRRPSTGSAQVDSAIHLLHSGASVWTSLNGRRAPIDPQGWGHNT